MIAAGGTAGHVVPAIAVADALRDSGRARVSFLGTPERAEAELVAEAGYEIDFLRVQGLDRRNPVKALVAAGQAARAVTEARRVLTARQTDVVLGGGGYVAGPAGLAALRMGLPLVLTEADSHLGLANRLLAKRARAVCLAFPIPGREGGPYVVTGRPVPRAVLEADPTAARRRFGIPEADRCVAVVGGSLGARSINEAALSAFGEAETSPARGAGDPWIVHVAGRRDFPALRERWERAGCPERYLLLEYEPSLGDVLAASDLVVARAGGSVMEFAAAGLGAVLVPYPHATGDHQSANARWMAAGGAAVTIADSELTPDRLRTEVMALLADEGRLAEMSAAARRLAKPDAAEKIAAEVLKGGETMNRRKLHFIAIGGAGMSGLALVCHELGATVTGSDRVGSSYIERLRAAGLEPAIGHDARNVPEGAEVVISTAIGEDNPELARAREREQTVIHRGELLAELCAGRRLLAVAGTHGKTTTAAMCVHALRATGTDPWFFLGGELSGAGAAGEPANAARGESEWIIAEADESDASFLGLSPELAVITNLELDHHSRWSSLRELTEAFAAFASSATGLVVGADVGLPGHRAQIRFALEPAPGEPPPSEADLVAEGIEARPGGGIRFSAHGPEIDCAVELAVPGRHNVANALAALGALTLAGADPVVSARALASFGGVARRMELKGERDGARIYDDYAHHPTEVRAALAAARELGPRRLIAAFQPHLYSRTKALAAEFGAALAAADEVIVLDVYPAREQPVGALEGVSGLTVADAAADHAGGRPVWWLPDAELAASALGPRLREGDVLLTIGAGDIFRLAEALVDGEDSR